MWSVARLRGRRTNLSGFCNNGLKQNELVLLLLSMCVGCSCCSHVCKLTVAINRCSEKCEQVAGSVVPQSWGLAPLVNDAQRDMFALFATLLFAAVDLHTWLQLFSRYTN